MAEANKRIRVSVSGGCGFNSKAQAVFQTLKQSFNVSDDQIKIERAPGCNVEVFVEEGSSSNEVLTLEACQFNGQILS